MALTPRSVYRYYEVDGVPSSGKRRPKKAEIIQLLEQMQGSASAPAVVRQTRAELDAVTPASETYGGMVLNDPNPANNGYYSRDGGVWVFGRGFPDTFARVVLSGSGTVQTGIVHAGVNPASIEVFFAKVATPNTGVMTLSISGETPKPVVNLAGNPLSAGEWTGMVMFYLNDDGQYQLLIDAGAAASAAQSASEAADQKAYAEEWAQSDDPISAEAGGDGSTDRSAKYWAGQAGGIAVPDGSITAAKLTDDPSGLEAIQDKLGIMPNAFPASIAELQGLDGSAVACARLLDNLRFGDFVWDASDVSGEVTLDPEQIIWVAPTSDTTGASGAWVRQFIGAINTRWAGAVGDADRMAGTGTDDAGAIQAALDLGRAMGLTVEHEPLSICESAIRVRNQKFIGLHDSSGILIKGDHDGIVLTGLGDSSTNDYRTQIRGLEIRADGTQTAGKAGIRCGDKTQTGADRICAHFIVDNINFVTLNNSTNTLSDGIVFEQDGSDAFAYIGQIGNINIVRWAHPFYGIRQVNNIVFNGWRQSRCTRPFKIGDVKACVLMGFESGSNDHRAMDIHDCYGFTIIEPYCENNVREDLQVVPSKYDILIDARVSAGGYQDATVGSLRIIGGWFTKGSNGNSIAAIRWAQGPGVVVDGAYITDYPTYSVHVTDSANNKGRILNLNTSIATSIGASAQVVVGY